MTRWTLFPHVRAFPLDAETLRRKWNKLHATDQEPRPEDPKVLNAWVHYHRGQFQMAYDAGLKAGPGGITVANKAACTYATFLEPREKSKLELFHEVSQRCAEQIAAEPDNINAHYLQGYALGRYSQGISVAKALALGLGGKIKNAFETTIRLAPKHADAHIALGTFHAEVIDKVGALIGNMTYGVKKSASLQLFEQGLALSPKSPVALMEYAHALVMLHGEAKHDESTALLEQAAACKPLDAVEKLEADLAAALLAA